MKTHFDETQKFSQTLIWIILFIALGISFVSLYLLVTSFMDGTLQIPAITFVAFLIPFLIVPIIMYIIYSAKLETNVEEDGLIYRFFPLIRSSKKILWEDIEKMEIITYRPLLDYGGYGIRWGTKGKAINVSGDKGLQIIFKDGKKLLIGTNKPDELLIALKGLNRAQNKLN
jgi:Family of unknown function (DUF6141)